MDFTSGGGNYKYIRILLLPLLQLVQSLSHLDINYNADIGPGILIHHSTMGVVISGHAVIGQNLTLVGGNVIGIDNTRKSNLPFCIGSNVFLGANAVIIGPVTIGNNVKIGASACVIKNVPSSSTNIGVPSKTIVH